MTHERDRPRAVLAASPVGIATARDAGLRYVSDELPGIRRRRAGRGFCYVGPDGEIVRDRVELQRIRSLAIPPAWTDVWICPSPRGHIQATGRDEKGRKQYLYHLRWREVRDQTKFGRLLEFGRALPRIRERVAQDLALPGVPRAKVLAAVVRLLDTSLIRVGNREYARANESFGLTTLHDDHVDISGSTLRFHFRGKAGREHVVKVRDRRLARIVKRLQDIPGQELFQYVDAHGQRHTIESADVNEYLGEISGEDFTAKDFRTWAGTVHAVEALQQAETATSESHAKKTISEAIKAVAERLGNTPTICRKSYVHPVVLDAYRDGKTLQSLRQRIERRWARNERPASDHDQAKAEEIVLALLRRNARPLLAVGGAQAARAPQPLADATRRAPGGR